GSRLSRRGARSRGARTPGNRREARRPGGAAERVRTAEHQDGSVRRTDVRRSDVQHRPRDRRRGSEGPRERRRPLQPADEGVVDDQSGRRQSAAMNPATGAYAGAALFVGLIVAFSAIRDSAPSPALLFAIGLLGACSHLALLPVIDARGSAGWTRA